MEIKIPIQGGYIELSEEESAEYNDATQLLIQNAVSGMPACKKMDPFSRIGNGQSELGGCH